MKEFLLKKGNKNLILLVHGFTGGKETWVEKGVNRIPDYLKEDEDIKLNYDIAYFEYFTKFTDKIEKIKWLFGLITGSKKKFKQNLSIDDIKDILFSTLIDFFKRYDKIVIIAHSMGGIITKSAILKLSVENKKQIDLFISLAVPHNGSNLANLGKLILNNPNINELTPLNKIIDKISRDWIEYSVKDALPETIYFQGKNDNIVSNQSSIGYSGRKEEVVYSDDDHFSILIPENNDSIVLKSIIDLTLDILKKTPKKNPLITSHISEESIAHITDRIGNKLGLALPKFENQLYTRDSIPQLSSNISKRSKTIKTLLRETEKKWIMLNGMYGTGKTQLAILIAQYLEIETIWISFNDSDGKSILEKIFKTFEVNTDIELKSKLDKLFKEKKHLLILDNLPTFGIHNSVDNSFNSFISNCVEYNIIIISTSHYTLPSSIKSVHNNNVFEKQIPFLNLKECNDIIKTYPNSIHFNSTKALHAITNGHPLYFQVICRYLQNTNWVIKEEQLFDFFTGQLFSDLTDETLSKFILKVEDENTRELLYRLNVIKGDVTESKINVVAQCKPKIDKPFEKILGVTGSWVQRDGNKYFISPLFKRLGDKHISKALLCNINYNLGKSILSKQKVSQFDVQDAIMHFISSKKYDDAGFIILKFMQHCLSQPNQFFDSNFELYTWYFNPIPKEMNLILRLLIRSLQVNFEFNKLRDNDKDLNFLRKDLILLVDEALKEKVDVYFPALILSTTYIKEESSEAIKYFSLYVNSYAYGQLPEMQINEESEILKFDKNVVWLLLYKVDDVKSLKKWFENVGQMDKSINDIDSEQAYLFSEKLFHNFIVKEKKSLTPDWNGVLEIFSYIYNKSLELDILILKAFAIKEQIIILSEMLHDISSAEKLYLEFKDSLQQELAYFLITDEIGRQFHYHQNNENAEKYLSEVVNIEVEKFVTVKADTFLTLGKINGDKNIEKAHLFIERGLGFMTDNIFIDEISYIQYIGEYATSLFLLNKNDEAILKFIEGYELLLNSFQENSFYINTQVRYGNAIGYISKMTETGLVPEDNFTKPYLGFISNNKDLNDLYFSEKLLLNIFIIIQFFEKIDDEVKAKHWAQKIFDLKDKYGIGIFYRMLNNLIGYEIMNGELNTAFELQKENIYLNQELLKRDLETIENQIEKDLVESFQKKIRLSKKDSDFDLIMFSVVPVLFYLLKQLLREEIKISDLVQLYLETIRKYSEIFTNKELYKELNYIIKNFPNNSEESKSLLDHVNRTNPAIFGYIQSVAYLICPLSMNSKEAIEFHFKLFPELKIYGGSIETYLVIPFLIEFWKNKLKKEPEAFHNIGKLYENLNKIDRVKINLRIKGIFSLISESLKYNLNESDKLWLEEYWEEYE
ncbi:alpha/beta hydrolase [Aequorivita viscosa]|uniref:PGAP1-like protein n=1 Tax=Aequorivita viscosa TaxID=797419 RepID=A0A1M6M0L8_9FLAO|nr:NB-ARC domain-containing protein [Aequorivita viscosa]SDX31841.1 PGAP1-like protein [Aequorivita viscosa]SHJ76954.1 PGAP1-like protein [Aequorivita viscosa]